MTSKTGNNQTRRIRSDSFTTEGEMMRAQRPAPPDHVYLREQDLPYWAHIIDARAYDAWTPSDLENAASLAWLKAEANALARELEGEEATVENPKTGALSVNPKHKLLESYQRRIIALSRYLHVHPVATEGRGDDRADRNSKARELRQQAQGDDDGDDLIAKPVH